jgi:elongation factor 1 alpha-like protein
MSKLQALAAARKKKAQEQKSSKDPAVEKPMAELDLNGGSGKKDEVTTNTVSAQPTTRSFPIRKRKDSNPHERVEKSQAVEKNIEEVSLETANVPEAENVEPSAFASTMFGDVPANRAPKTSMFSMPYNMSIKAPEVDPFAGPSPDDVVIAAQSQSKGVNSSVKPGTSKK